MEDIFKYRKNIDKTKNFVNIFNNFFLFFTIVLV